MSRLFCLKVIIVLAGVLLALPQAMPAFACTPPPGGLPNYTAADRTKAAPLVLEGAVIAVSVETTQVGVVQVTRYFKGIGPQLIAIAPTPTPYVPVRPPPLISFEVVGSLGLGCLIGLTGGLALGVVVGITIEQRD